MLSVIDIIAGLLCIVLFYQVLAARIRNFDPAQRRLLRRAFRFRMLCVVVYSLITAYYYQGGDTEMFLYATRDIHSAISNGDISFFDLIFILDGSDDNNPLRHYFILDDTRYPVAGFMSDSGNFMVPK